MTIRSCLTTRQYLSAALLGMLVGFPVIAAVQAKTLVVGQGAANKCNNNTPTFKAIQDAINSASSGDMVYICPDIYDEQVLVSSTKSNITIRGSGAGLTVLRPKPATVVQITTSIATQTLAAPIVLVDGDSNITIGNLTIDGSAADSGAILNANCLSLPFYIGIFYRLGSGTVDTVQVTGITSGKACAGGGPRGKLQFRCDEKPSGSLRSHRHYLRWGEYHVHYHGKYN